MITDEERWQQMFCYELALYGRGVGLIAGIDEAGRGPLAGPVTAAAVILPRAAYLPGLNDSKQLTPKRRAVLEVQIKEQALTWACVDVGPEVIDRINILQAARLAMAQAVAALAVRPEHLLIDAVAIEETLPQTPIIKGDAKSVSVAAASILAKTHRDRLMEEYELLYPGYGFARHKGYPTQEHRERLRQLGPCPIHRLSFSY